VEFGTDGQSASMSWYRAHDQILHVLYSVMYLLIDVGRPLWREDESVGTKLFLVHRFLSPDDGSATFLRNVGSYKSHTE
jgi:hypothetical protein